MGMEIQNIVREIIAREKPDALMLFTDPRYFTAYWNMEHEIRKKIPIAIFKYLG